MLGTRAQEVKCPGDRLPAERATRPLPSQAAASPRPPAHLARLAHGPALCQHRCLEARAVHQELGVAGRGRRHIQIKARVLSRWWGGCKWMRLRRQGGEQAGEAGNRAAERRSPGRPRLPPTNPAQRYQPSQAHRERPVCQGQGQVGQGIVGAIVCNHVLHRHHPGQGGSRVVAGCGRQGLGLGGGCTCSAGARWRWPAHGMPSRAVGSEHHASLEGSTAPLSVSPAGLGRAQPALPPQQLPGRRALVVLCGQVLLVPLPQVYARVARLLQGGGVQR